MKISISAGKVVQNTSISCDSRKNRLKDLFIRASVIIINVRVVIIVRMIIE